MNNKIIILAIALVLSGCLSINTPNEVSENVDPLTKKIELYEKIEGLEKEKETCIKQLKAWSNYINRMRTSKPAPQDRTVYETKKKYIEKLGQISELSKQIERIEIELDELNKTDFEK